MLKNINNQKMNGQNNGNNNNNNTGKLLPISSTTASTTTTALLQSTQSLLKKPFPITSNNMSQEFLTSKSLSSSGIIVTAPTTTTTTTIIPTLSTTAISSISADITTTTSSKSIKNSIGKLTPKDLLVVSTKKLMDNQQQQQQQQQQLNQQNIKNNIIKSNSVLDNNNIIKKPQIKQDKMEQQKLHQQQQQQKQLLQNQDTEDSRSKKKRCADRYDSSESSDSGVATLSCTDSSTASSDASDPGSPYSPLSGNGDDLQNQSGRKKSLSSSSLSSTSNCTTIATNNTTNISSNTEGLLTLKAKSMPTSIIMPPSQVILAKTKLNDSTVTSVVNCNNGKISTATTSASVAAVAVATAIATSTTNSTLSSIHLKTPSPTSLQINQAIQSQIQHQTQLKQSSSILQQQKINLNLWPWHKVHQNNNNNNNNNILNNNIINNNNNLDKLSSSSSSLTITTTTPTSSPSNATNTANNQTLNDTQNVTNSTTTSFSAGSINMTSGVTNIDSNNLSANNIKINNCNNNINKCNKRSSTQNVNDNINNNINNNNNNSCTITTTTANKKSRLNNNNNNSINSNSSNNSNNNSANANNINNSNLLTNQSIPPLISTTQSVSTITNPIGIIAATTINNSNTVAVQQALKTSLSNTSTVSSTTGIGNKRLKLATNEESQTKITGYFKMKHKSKPLNHAAQPMDIKSITTSTTTTTCITTINTTTVASNNSKTRTISSIPPLLRKIDRSKTKVAQVAPNLRKTTLTQTNVQLPLLAPKSPKKPVAIAPRISDIKSKATNSLISQSTTQASQLKATNPVLLAASSSTTGNQSQPPPLQSIDPTKLTVSAAATQQTAQSQPAVLLTAIRIPQQQAAQLQLANAANSLNKNGNGTISNSNQNGKLNQIPTSATLTSATTTNGSLYQIPMMPNLVQIPNIIATANANGGTNLLVQPNGHLAAATRVNNSNMAAAAAAAAAQLQLYGTVLKFQQQIAAAAAAASQSNQQSNNAANNLLTMDPTQLSNLLMKSSITQNVIPLSTINTTTTTVATNQQSKTIATNSVLPNLQQSQTQNILTAQPPQLSRITAPQVFMATSNGYLLNATTLPTGAIFANAAAKSSNSIPQTMPALQPIQSSSIQTSNSNQQSTNAAASFLPSLSAILQAHQNHQHQAASIILNAAAQLPDSTTGNNFLSAALAANAQTETKGLPPLLPTSNLSSFTTNNTSNAAAVAALAKSGQHPSVLGKPTLISTSQVPPPPLVLSNTEIAKKISSITKPNQRGRKPTSLPTLATTTKPQRKKRVTKNATNIKTQLNQQKIRPKEKIDMVPLVPLVPISNKTTIKLPIDSKTKISFNRSSPPPLEEIKKPINISSSLPPPIVPISREKLQISKFEQNMNFNLKCDRLPELSFEGKIEKQINEKLIENAERKIDNTIRQQQNCNMTVNETKVNQNITHDEDSSNKSTSPLFIENDAHKIEPLIETQKEISDESCSKEATKESFDESVEMDDRSDCDRSEFEGKLIIKEDMSFGNEMESEFKKQEEEEIETMQKPKSTEKDDEIENSQQNDFSNFEKENFEADIFEDSIKNNFEKIFDGDFEEKLEKKLIAFEEKLRQNYKEQYKENYEANVDALADEKVKEKFASLSQQIDESIKEDVIKMESSQHLKIFSESSLSSNSSFSISSGVVANAIAAAAAEDTTTSSLHLSIDSQMYDSQLAAEVQVKLQDISISKSGFFSNATPPCILSSSSSSTTMSSALQSTASICTLGNTFNTSTTTTTAVSTILPSTKIDENINLPIFEPTLIDTDMANDITEKAQSLGVETLQKCAISPILSQPKTIRFPAPGEMGQRFGSKGFKRRDGVCYWDGCNTKHETCSKLLDHMQSFHVNSQTGPFKCLWNGCKVHGRESCSRRWLERHVLSHGGSKMFKCIVDGCGLRFSSQLALQKHVNGHFNTMDNKDSNPKRTSDPPMPKQLKKTGKKLRYRLQPFSARMFDYIDSGIMEGLVHRLRIRTAVNGAPGDHLVFNGHPIARRTNLNGIKEVLVRWTPAGIIDNEWVIEPKQIGPESIIKRMKYTDFSCDEKINLNNYLRSANLHTDICTMTKRNSLAAFSFVSHNEIIHKLFGDDTENVNNNLKNLNNRYINFDPNNDCDDEPSMSSTSTTTLDSILSSQNSDENDYSGDSCYSTSTKCSGNNRICKEKELRFTERLNRKQSRKPRKLNTEPS